MVEVIFSNQFRKKFSKIKDHSLKIKIKKQIKKISKNPLIGKPMRNKRKNTRELYISPYRLSYLIENDIVYILSIYHKDDQ